MKKLIRKFSIITGYRFWYQVTIFYKDKKGNLILSIDKTVGLAVKSDILNSRIVGNVMPLHKDKSLPKKYLCNGVIFIKVVSYMGYLKK